ncbi:MAG: SMP-30/gluconolactonase/LRE family protein [Treponema sp.]|jgi:sugar lactone lactonase YvrE|nr:SMP-30/gluconolactonase/LRE family protein [Treponema sp.]
MASQKTYRAELLLDRRFLLGEGPAYDSRKDRIIWVDIHTGAFFSWNPKTHKLEETKTGQNLGAIVPTEKGRYLAAMATGVYYLDNNGLSLLCRPPELMDNLRLNDAKCDPAGRFWFGTTGLFGNAPEGSLFRLDPDGNCRLMLKGPKTSNGLAWSNDKKTMYYIDSGESSVDAFDYDHTSGSISNRRRLLAAEGHTPDGMTIDEEGKLWIALWGGGKVIRFDPENREIIGEIPLPAKNTTSCCFAGENLDTLIITSSGEGFDDPKAGCVFYANPGICGAPTWCYNDTV